MPTFNGSENHWDALQNRLEGLAARLDLAVQERGYEENAEAQNVVRHWCDQQVWLLPLIQVMRTYPNLTQMYPSDHNGYLRLSAEPLLKDSEITYDLTPAFPIWFRAQSAGRYRAIHFSVGESERAWQSEIVAEGDAREIASYAARQMETVEVLWGSHDRP